MKSKIIWNVQLNRFLIMKDKEKFGYNSDRSLIFVEKLISHRKTELR